MVSAPPPAPALPAFRLPVPAAPPYSASEPTSCAAYLWAMHRLPLQKPAVGPSPPQNDLNAGAQFLVTPDSDPHQPPSFHSAAQGHLALGSENVDANLSRDSYSDGGNNYVLSKPAPNNKSLPSQATQSISIPRTPSLQIYTDLPSIHTTAPLSNGPCEADTPIRASSLSSSLPRRTPSIRTALAAAHSCAGSISPNSAFSSPQLAALVDITPLPSPTFLRSSSWKSATSKSPSRTPSPSPISGSTFSIRRIGLSERPRSSSDRQQAQPNSEFQLPEPEEAPDAIRQNMHTRNRSLSDYKPDTLHVPPSHKAAPSRALLHNHTTALAQDMATRNNMHREDYLAVQRGISSPSPTRLPTPPRIAPNCQGSSDTDHIPILVSPVPQTPIYDVISIRTQQPRRYRMLRKLGQGTFSKVVLAMRDDLGGNISSTSGGSKILSSRLVAIKVVDREVEILKTLNHPSLVQLKAFGGDNKRALLVLDYCPGGDLFEFASRAVNPLSQHIIRRIFAELVAAVQYLHAHFIVHRDIKLENVLINIPASVIQDVSDWRTYPRALVTLSDLGLSKRIPEPPTSPLLHTRCGSEDYAAPEILMGQAYDGRSTDAWAMGVLLYAIMENRLPFDPLPGARGDPAKLRARTPHRIARCEWSWYRFSNEEGDWDPVKGEQWEGARACVEGLLRRSTKRMGLYEISRMPWVHEAIDDREGLKKGDIEVP
ncbi:conserved hypothetical protein [Histoplasma capsulatum G186AR]|uniref:Protein kinase domain-containing protein n=1 Tax=Ajellomyces capsulatus (strain G186AR / H82 / ATCC MYA-2454 / RMSCC 2432) TaxID=447093 RepID=C0NA33_AJECG|nr:uncharacterized protein HCBG_01192 [Histoplasma capsulatum G186AR]EEH11737.1 conserved hypothetical protein [Histoplasma capsulatum G186AR]